MAALDKLAIRNIRSFDNNISVIQFYSPLTVIVGQNGSGKTTIIECLNYITTGNMPPNTKGGAFIHDPKLVNEKEVKAQVRLRFWDAAHNRYNVVRNLQVTTKKGGNLSMSTLETLLQLDVDEKNQVGGKRKRNTTLSSRCAEIDEVIPQRLGVSTSILENVIFCHQEDSNWPLSEPAKLKTKFDNIFEATRFTKALKHIKDLHKERIADCKADKVRLESLQEDRSRANSIRERKAKLEADRVNKEAEREDLEVQVKKVAEENTKLAEAYSSFREKLAEAESLDGQIKLIKKNMEVLNKDMSELKETDEELKKRKDDFKKHLDSQRSKSARLEQAIQAKTKSRKELDDALKRQFGRKSALEQDKQRHEKAVEDRKKLIRTIGGQAGIQGYNMDSLRDDEVATFLTKLREQVDKAEDEHQKLKAELRATLKRLDDQHAEAQGEVKGKRIQLSTQHEIIRKTNINSKKLEEDLDELASSEHELEAAQKRLEEAKARLAEIREAQSKADYDDRLRSLSSRLREAEERRDEANEELTGLNARADLRARLTLKESDQEVKKELLQSLIAKSNESMLKATGKETNLATFEDDVERLVRAKDEELAKARRTRANDERQLQQIEFSLSSKRKELKEKEQIVTDVEKKVQDALNWGGETFLSLDALQENLEELIVDEQGIINMADGGLKYVQLVISNGKKTGTCPVCERSLEDDEEKAGFDRATQQILKTLQSYLSPDAPKKIDKYNDRVSQIKLLRVKAAEAQDLKTKTIVALRDSIKQEEERLQLSAQGLEKSASAIDKIEREAKDLSILKRNSVEAARVTADLKALENEIAGLIDDLATSGNTRSVEDVTTSISQLTDEIKQLKRDVKTVTDERDAARGKFAAAERECHRDEIALRDQQEKNAKRKSKLTELSALKETLKQAKEAAKQIETEIASAQAAQRRAQDELETQRSEGDRRLSAAQKQVNQFQEYNSELMSASRRVDEWVKQRGEEHLTDCIRAMADNQADLDALDGEITTLTQQKAAIDTDLQQARVTERNLEDNLRYRDMARQVAEMEEKKKENELKELFDVYKLYKKKYEDGRNRENEIQGKIQHLLGVIQGLGDQIHELGKDLKTHYNNIDKKFTEQLVKTKVNELANYDLEKTAKAVDAAILKYHSIKMEEINEHIRYLWSKTYQGTDIDTILIKSDPDGGKGSKSYNYRVCMVKDTVEMDMRGRCSAGQKVLASIIIRLALADSFSTNCGILALDEPTTNLDKDNIDALAAALADLIKERAKSNFQLIVITHDEDFLGRLGQQDVIEYYWRVSRNVNQKSEITRHRLNA